MGDEQGRHPFRTELSTLEKRFILSYYEPWFMEKNMAFKALLLHEDRKEKGIDTGIYAIG